MGYAPDRGGFFTLQEMIWPDARLNSEPHLYLRELDVADPGLPDGRLEIAAGQTVGFDTYFNLFSLEKWQRDCALSDLHLALQGAGDVTVIIGRDTPGPTREILREVDVTLTLAPSRVDLSDIVARCDGPGVIWFVLRARKGGCRFDTAAWQTRQPPRRAPQLTLAITTFRREVAVAASVARFTDYIARSDLAAYLHLVVVDNGQSAQIPPSDHVSLLPNENLGGAGGFARGLIEAQARGATHCLFMDDDAAVHMGSIDRTWRYLAWVTDPATAVAGAMSMAAQKWRLWENGALFDRRCRPLHLGTDLRNIHQVAPLEWADPSPGNHYGGWWYFAFPIEKVRHMPFPFFVRGDDVSFGLVHDFRIQTLPGVMSFQDQDFADKESLQTLYLDLRSHLAHHLALPQMEIGRAATLRIAWWFFARSAVQLHYETLAALNLSFADALEGPAFFARNADMTARRADLTRLRQSEAWHPIPQGVTPPKTRRWLNPDRRWVRIGLQITLNGHLLPGFRFYGNHVVLHPGQRGQLHPCWGAARVTYWDAQAGQFFTMRHSKTRFARQFLRLMGHSLRLLTGYGGLKRRWQMGYARLTRPEWWHKRLGVARG